MTGRFDYIRYDERSRALQAKFRSLVQDLESTIEQLPDETSGRGRSLALIKLEECYMWIGKAIRDEQVARVGGSVEEPRRG